MLLRGISDLVVNYEGKPEEKHTNLFELAGKKEVRLKILIYIEWMATPHKDDPERLFC